MQNREHGRMILESVEHEKIQADCDLKATNVILQGLPSDIYSLVNHHRVAKDLWEKVQLLMQVNQQTHLAEFYQIDSSLAVPMFKQGDDPIDAINKMMSFLSTVITSRFPSTNNQLKNSSNPRQQVTIHDGQCLKPKRKRDATWFREKVLLVKAQGNGKVLNEEELEFLVDPGIAEGGQSSSYGQFVLLGSDVLSEDTNSSAQQDALILFVFEQMSNQVTNCNKVNNDNLITNESLSAELERYKERVKLLEERQNVDLDIVNIVVNSSLDINTSANVHSSVAMNDSVNYVENCNKFLELEAELIKQHNMVETDEYNRLLKSFSKLEQH
ncbi:hypothetical protein Tco_1361486 [Tanacetum coccineum]